MTVGDNDQDRMRWEAFDLAPLEPEATASVAHPDGVCFSEYMLCRSCNLLAPLGPGYCGSKMAHCRLCGFAWMVNHDPELCRQREDLLGLHLTEEHVTALMLARLELP
ncbi:hypothetical protein OG373_14135 [Streptomyces avidinii]|uniref:hypothetical protein n=1 Tax=Streptomyces avidinii TaxID=1895 RepID=UPI003869DE8B|nr:hypothetical protein OG373_14135 [Streptomyces avidinii]